MSPRIPGTNGRPPDLGGLPDLSKLADDASGKPIGEATPVGVSRVDRVIVVLKDDGELTRHDLEQVAEFAKAAAIQASRMPR